MTEGPAPAASPGARRTSFPTAESPQGSPLAAGVDDLHGFFNDRRLPAERSAAPRTRRLASSLFAHLMRLDDLPADHRQTLPERVITDQLVREECDRDQNVYLGLLFTRFLSHAVPDVVFLPASAIEVAEAFVWARGEQVPVTLRGAASAAMGGAVPCDGGLTLDLSRLDRVDVSAEDDVCVVGGGAHMREIHRRLAEHDLALPVYSSNLGGTYAGWLVTGALGLNAFGPGTALSVVRAADVVLPGGEMIRLHADGRLDVPADEPRRARRELPPDQAEGWFRQRGLPFFGLADLVGSEGTLGAVVQLVLRVGRRPCVGALLLGFEAEEQAFRAVGWIADAADRGAPRPANMKLTLAGHLRHARTVWADEDARAWRRLPSALSAGEGMPWSAIAGPAELGVAPEWLADGQAARECAAHVYIDFLDETAARTFAARLSELPGRPRALAHESARVAADRFRPQQNKRLGPGLLAAEIELPAGRVQPFLTHARRVATNAGVQLDPEVYYVNDGRALVIAGYLTDHRATSFYSDLVLSPALLDLAIRRYGGRPYVLGRWQAAFAPKRFGEAGIARLRSIKRGLDPDSLVNRGVVFEMGLRGLPGAVTATVYAPGVSALGRLWGAPGLGATGRVARAVLSRLPGPARGHGEELARAVAAAPTARAIHCVNCGECNGVCPVYHRSTVRLPQTLVHWGEGLYARRRPLSSLAVLLDLCMRCGNCEEVCQAGIHHIEVYDTMAAQVIAQRGEAGAEVSVSGRRGEAGAEVSAAGQTAVDMGMVDGDARGERHVAMLAALRASSGYRNDFLRVRPGMYLRRSPAALTGTVGYLVLRAENDAGPAASCLHCGACVPVCPTAANREFEDTDARLITTDQTACVGCAACVEVCPANRQNGGQTLRVVEAPAAAWLAAMDDFEAAFGPGGESRA
jgi:FAD/FMN-containing dehydrogenase/ferredoxin